MSFGSLQTSVRLFDLYPQIFYKLKNYIGQSDDNKRKFLNAIEFEKLYHHDDLEYQLLVECSKTNSLDIIRLVFQVYESKLYQNDLYKNKLQKVTLNLIKNWVTKKRIFGCF